MPPPSAAYSAPTLRGCGLTVGERKALPASIERIAGPQTSTEVSRRKILLFLLAHPSLEFTEELVCLLR